jgi:putative endonuclease
MDARHARGRATEQQACDYLLAQGLKLLARNVRSRGGEIDLVMQDGSSLVFVEVRYRRSKRYANDPAGHLASRFDVIAVHGEPATDIEWIRNAFEV